VVFLVTWAREGGALESSKEQQLEEKMWVWWLMMGGALESSKEQQLEEKMWVWWLMKGGAMINGDEQTFGIWINILYDMGQTGFTLNQI
jgi:hypothetical protein